METKNNKTNETAQSANFKSINPSTNDGVGLSTPDLQDGPQLQHLPEVYLEQQVQEKELPSEELIEKAFLQSFPKPTTLEQRLDSEEHYVKSGDDLLTEAEQLAENVKQLSAAIEKGFTELEDEVTSVSLTNLKVTVELSADTLLNDAGFLELKRSIHTQGITTPLWVSKENKIINGHRRYLAAKMLGIESLYCIYAKDDIPDDKLPIYSYHSNIQRKVTFVEMAEYVDYLFNQFRKQQHYTFGGNTNNNFKAAQLAGVTISVVNNLRKIKKANPTLLSLMDKQYLSISAACNIADMPENIRSAMVDACSKRTLTPKDIIKVAQDCKKHPNMAKAYIDAGYSGAPWDFFDQNSGADNVPDVPCEKPANTPHNENCPACGKRY
ncbi:MAG: ParB N-terminal domain-containing protein [Bacteroidia bacterium]